MATSHRLTTPLSLLPQLPPRLIASLASPGTQPACSPPIKASPSPGRCLQLQLVLGSTAGPRARDLCVCVCKRLCAQPGKVAVQERCQQPRNRLEMESVSQNSGSSQKQCSSPTLLSWAVSSAWPQRKKEHKEDRGARRRCVGAALGFSAAEGRGGSRREEPGLCLCALSGSTMSPFTRLHSPHLSVWATALHSFSLLSCRAVEANTLQQERLQAIAVSPLWVRGWHQHSDACDALSPMAAPPGLHSAPRDRGHNWQPG